MSNQQVVAEALTVIQGEALNTAWERYDLPSKLAGGAIFLGGSFVLGAMLPGLGPWVAYAAAAGIAGGGFIVSAKEGEAIEAGDMDAVARYLTPEKLATILKPYEEKLVKKISPQQRGQDQTASQSMNKTQPQANGESATTLDGLLETAIASSVLLASLRGTGKTSLLQELFSHAMPGHIIGLDPKNSNSLGALEPFFRYAPPSDSETYLSVVLGVRDEMRRRNRARLKTEECEPLWLVIDEYQTTRTNWHEQTQESIKNALSEIVNQGRERRVFAVLMGQSPLCGDIGFSGGERANMSILALGCAPQTGEQGGGGGWDSTDRLLKSSHIIPNKQTRDRLLADYSGLKEGAGIHGRVLVSPAGSCSVPDLSRKHYTELPHKLWAEAEIGADESVEPEDNPCSKYCVQVLVEDLVSNSLCPIRAVDLGKRYWAQKLQRGGVIEKRDTATMQDVIDHLCLIYEPFYSDSDGRLLIAS